MKLIASIILFLTLISCAGKAEPEVTITTANAICIKWGQNLPVTNPDRDSRHTTESVENNWKAYLKFCVDSGISE